MTKRVTFHRFRDTFASLQLAAGTDIYTVSKMLDHAYVTTTHIYAKLVDSTKRDTVDRFKLT
ncbi:MAG: tyrosine-type recombinase/integrase [Muribaculaceae bacterium]|nr:tyrosine-type recombinase/integrase [Muribaculaceae bacterium]